MGTKIDIVVDRKKLEELVIGYLSDLLNIDVSPGDVAIETKSVQNYKAEWEIAEYRARITKEI